MSRVRCTWSSPTCRRWATSSFSSATCTRPRRRCFPFCWRAKTPAPPGPSRSRAFDPAGLDQIQFFDFQNGWISGANLLGAPRDPFFLITTDGGKTWRQRPVFEESRLASIERFRFESPQNGSMLVDARLDNNRRELYETRTGGESWELKQASVDPIPFPGGNTTPAPTGWRLRADAKYAQLHGRAFRWRALASAQPVSWSSWSVQTMKPDPIELELFRHLLVSIAEEMGAVLRKTSYSANIKERRDYSCAVYDAAGETVAMGDHMPVHLGAMPLSVRYATEAFDLGPGDVAILNDPFRGGTHLPDITAVSGVFVRGSRKPAFFVANRAHHADVGGMSPGIDAAGARDLPGRHSHSADSAGARRAVRSGTARPDPRQCANAGGARGRSAGAVHGDPARRTAPARIGFEARPGHRAPQHDRAQRLQRADDALGDPQAAARPVSLRRFSGQRRHHEPAGAYHGRPSRFTAIARPSISPGRIPKWKAR